MIKFITFWWLRAATRFKLQLPQITSPKILPSVRIIIINRWKKIFFMNSIRRGLSFESEESFQAARDVEANFN